MARRIFFGFAVISVLVGFASSSAVAQSGRTFYIDYVNGTNGNNGTSKSTPWKTHPYMQTGSACTGTGSAPSYSHQAGDHFIFKGGVTWPAACFQLYISNGGTSSANDYYGVDLTWFAGSTFARALFDMAYIATTGNHVISVASGASNVTIDNIEIKRQQIQANGGYRQAGYGVTAITYPVTVRNSYFHDWATSGNFTDSTFGDWGSGCIQGAVIMDSTTCSDAAGYIFSGGVQHSIRFDGACENCAEVKNSTFHDVMAACFNVFNCHDSEFYNVSSEAQTYCDTTGAGCHTQIIEPDGGHNGNTYYNNLIHDNTAAVTIFGCTGDSIYNNVIWNSGNFAIMLDTNCSNSTSTTVANIYNNTVDCSNSAGCFRYFYRSSGVSGILNLRNNQWIANGNPVCYNNVAAGCSNVNGGSQTNNLTMSAATALSQGYTSGNKYSPTSSTVGTVNAAVDLSGLCVGGLGSLCADRLHVPRQTSWDVGAYVFSGTSSKPNPPTNLNAAVQ